jgi:hypothetical protein
MSDQVREQGRRQREDARERRRSLTERPFEELDEAASGAEPPVDVRALAKRAVRTAAAAALAGGLAGAAKAVIDRRKHTNPEAGEEDEGETDEEGSDEPAGRQAANTHEDEPADREAAENTAEDEPEADASPEPSGERDENPVTARADEPPEDDHAAEEADEAGERGGDGRQPQRPEHGLASGDVTRLIERAKDEVEELLGREPEGVSGIERSNGAWCVTVEVVEVHRVPDSTDVLASYGVVLDGDGNLFSLERKRRYRRSQVEEV